MIGAVVAAYPQLQVIATTLRVARTATRNDWGRSAGTKGSSTRPRGAPGLEIMDRVGGGDSFASG